MTAAKFCDRCGKPNRPQARFCGYCGQPFGVPLPEEEPDSNGSAVQRSDLPLDKEQALRRIAPQNGNSTPRRSFVLPIIISALLGLLVYTNPTLEEYGDFVQQQVMQQSKTPEERVAASLFTAPLMGWGLMLTTERANYYLFSVYETNLKEVGRLKAIGILTKFIVVETPQSSLRKPSSSSGSSQEKSK
jgi:hypothetical protein